MILTWKQWELSMDNWASTLSLNVMVELWVIITSLSLGAKWCACSCSDLGKTGVKDAPNPATVNRATKIDDPFTLGKAPKDPRSCLRYNTVLVTCLLPLTVALSKQLWISETNLCCARLPKTPRGPDWYPLDTLVSCRWCRGGREDQDQEVTGLVCLRNGILYHVSIGGRKRHSWTVQHTIASGCLLGQAVFTLHKTNRSLSVSLSNVWYHWKSHVARSSTRLELDNCNLYEACYSIQLCSAIYTLLVDVHFHGLVCVGNLETI